MRIFVAALIMALGGLTAQAQFHSQDKKTGQVGVNQAAVNSAQQQAEGLMSSQGGSAQLGTNENSTIYISEAHKQNYGARMGRQDSKIVHVWARSIHHSDGSYTESKQDELTNTLEQITKSKNGTKLQRRMVMLDENGRPTEVMIYDGRDQFKYRGKQLYDEIGRFSEEHLYDAKGTLIRRKVQEYDPQGGKLPARSWDYVANVPEDLKLVITRESEDQTNDRNEAASAQKKTLFGNKKNRQEPATQAAVGNAPAAENAAAPVKRKGLNLGRLFSGKKQAK
ncbi:MAG: hypothetical protein P1U87_06355 [Verrucomicrobiales bacterium]|nr:hypothetical protein [Verrucomicrobiales bacterium]